MSQFDSERKVQGVTLMRGRLRRQRGHQVGLRTGTLLTATMRLVCMQTWAIYKVEPT